MNVSAPALSEKDVEDLELRGAPRRRPGSAVVRRVARRDRTVHEVMDCVGRRVPVIAKLEKPEAIDNLEAIVLVFDVIMVVCGDPVSSRRSRK